MEFQKKTLLDFERPRLDDSLYVENTSAHSFMRNPSDGLPMPEIQQTMTDTEAADLTPERFVCMGTVGFMLPFFGQVGGRKPCVHYRRQLLPSQDKQNTVCIRYCTAIKDDTGEMADIGNTEVLACELRHPRDPVSERALDAFDHVIMQRQKDRKSEDKPFNVDDALKEG